MPRNKRPRFLPVLCPLLAIACIVLIMIIAGCAGETNPPGQTAYASLDQRGPLAENRLPCTAWIELPTGEIISGECTYYRYDDTKTCELIVGGILYTASCDRVCIADQNLYDIQQTGEPSYHHRAGTNRVLP